jgi:concanavalin A-like lectin/glucanase superfamily protein/IPT/TIG domain-containing protein
MPGQPGDKITITPGPGMGPGGFGSSGMGETVTIGAAPATILLWTPTAVVVQVPTQDTYPILLPLILTTADGAPADTGYMTVYPVVTALSATTGQPGDSLTLTGLYFGSVTGTVKVAGGLATVTSWSPTSVTVTVPTAGSYPDAGNVILTTHAGNLALAPMPYTITAPTPILTHAQQPFGSNVTAAAVGTTLDVIGSGFGATQGTGTLTIHGHAATVSLWSNTRVTVTVPAETSYPDVSGIILTTGGGLVSNTLVFTTTGPPVLTSLSKAYGHPGDTLTLTGLRFGASQGGGGVTIGGTLAMVTAWADTSVTVTVPTRGSYPNSGSVVLTTAAALTSNGLTFLTLEPYALKAQLFATASSEFLYAPTSPTLDLSGSSFTLAFWFNPTDRSTWGIALAKAGFSAAADSYYVALNYGGTPGDIGFFIANGGSFYQPANLNFPVGSIGTWVFWVGVLDLGINQLYQQINNGPSASVACSVGCNSTASDLLLGTYGASHLSPGGNYLNAALDSCGIWGRALSGGELDALYNGGVGLAYQDLPYANGGSLLTGLNAWYDLDETTGNSCTDATGNGNVLVPSTPPPTQVTGIR